jgi:anti-sigma-K factor RskA
MTDEDDILAAEFAWGLLAPEESRAVQRRAKIDAVLSLRVAWWRDQLAPLVAEAEVAPPERLWAKILGQLPVNDNMPVLMKRWRALAIATSVAAALAILVSLRQPAPVAGAPRPALIVATLSGKNPAIVNVSYDGTSGQMIISPSSLSAGAGDAELWIIPEDGKPCSIGAIDPKAPAGRTVPTAQRAFLDGGATFAISLEPKGGSATGAPTGAVIATGKIISV